MKQNLESTKSLGVKFKHSEDDRFELHRLLAEYRMAIGRLGDLGEDKTSSTSEHWANSVNELIQ